MPKTNVRPFVWDRVRSNRSRLHHELIDFAGTVATTIERAIPGFRRAYLLPGEE